MILTADIAAIKSRRNIAWDAMLLESLFEMKFRESN